MNLDMLSASTARVCGSRSMRPTPSAGGNYPARLQKLVCLPEEEFVGLCDPGHSLFKWAVSYFGPQHALILRCNGRESPVQKLLDSLSAECFRGDQISLGVGRNTMDGIKLSWLPSSITKTRQDFHGMPIEDVNLVIRPVGKVNEGLLGIP